MSEMQDRVMRAIDEALFTEGVVITFSERVARAAIAAMREPTEIMVLASAKAEADQHYYKADAWDRGYCDDSKSDWLNGARYGHYAAIDAALA